MRKYQRVKVKAIKPGTLKNGCLFIRDMKRFWGQMAIITKITDKGGMNEQIGLCGQPGIENFTWKETWLESTDFLSDKDFEL